LFNFRWSPQKSPNKDSDSGATNEQQNFFCGILNSEDKTTGILSVLRRKINEI
jgi:hypothetical protein